jgi:hypothetical protein
VTSDPASLSEVRLPSVGEALHIHERPLEDLGEQRRGISFS